MTKELRLERYHNPFVAGDRFALYRMVDGRLEASGFETEDEATTWAKQNGWELPR